MHDLYVIIEYIQDVNVSLDSNAWSLCYNWVHTRHKCKTWPQCMDLYVIIEYIQDVNVRLDSTAWSLCYNWVHTRHKYKTWQQCMISML